MTKNVASLSDAKDISKFGGKAANLAQLLEHKVTVPEGIAVGVSGFASDGKLLIETQEVIETWLKNQPNKTKFAVRSSALNEDGQKQSWAGQFETYLKVPANMVVAKVASCHNAIGARAKAYAGDKTEAFAVAVIVQKMVQPDYAGVLFTRNPVDGSNQIVMEYVAGLAEQLVGGEVSPDSCVWDRQTKSLDSQLPFEAEELIDQALKIEKIYNSPQDIEWAIQDQKLYIVQTRPITTLNKS